MSQRPSGHTSTCYYCSVVCRPAASKSQSQLDLCDVHVGQLSCYRANCMTKTIRPIYDTATDMHCSALITDRQ